MAAFLPSLDVPALRREPALVNDGAPALPREPGRPSREQKVLDAVRGVLVLSGGEDPVAARGAAALTAERLGTALERELENIARSKAEAPRTRALERAQMRAALAQAFRDVEGRAAHAGRPVSLLAAKRLETAEGKRLLAYANVGGHRLYVWRRGALAMLAAPDAPLMREAHDGRISHAEARRAVDRLGERRERELSVGFFDAEPGDAFIALSAGVADRLPESTVVEVLAHARDARRAEDELQRLAHEKSLESGDGRAEAADMAASILAIPSGRTEPAAVPEPMDRASRIALENRLRREIEDAESYARTRARALGLPPGSPRASPDPLIRSLRRQTWEKERRLAELELEALRADVPRRYARDEAHPDLVRNDRRQLRRVVGYDARKDVYLVEDPARGAEAAHHRSLVPRFELEAWQPAAMLPLFMNDRFSLALEAGRPPEDWLIVNPSVDERGRVFIIDDKGARAKFVPASEVRAAVHERLRHAQGVVGRLHATARLLARERR